MWHIYMHCKFPNKNYHYLYITIIQYRDISTKRITCICKKRYTFKNIDPSASCTLRAMNYAFSPCPINCKSRSKRWWFLDQLMIVYYCVFCDFLVHVVEVVRVLMSKTTPNILNSFVSLKDTYEGICARLKNSL